MPDKDVAFSLIVAVKDEQENMAPLIGEIAEAMKGRDPSTISITVFAPPPEKALLDSYQKAHLDGALLAIPDLSRDEILKQLDAWTPLAKAYA